MPALAGGTEVPLLELWRARIAIHFDDFYAGIPIYKFPEDLRTYERILWERQPEVVVEVGVHQGGSALWLRDRLFDFQRYRLGPAPRVVAVDIDLAPARATLGKLPPEAVAGIELVEGDIGDGAIVTEVRDRIPEAAEVFVIEDAAHNSQVTLASLHALAPLIRPGGFYMVEDTCVDVESLRVSADWPRGAGDALDEWLTGDPLGRMFRRRGELQRYGLTCHPGGLIQRLDTE